jgi:hypothetical protein
MTWIASDHHNFEGTIIVELIHESERGPRHDSYFIIVKCNDGQFRCILFDRERYRGLWGNRTIDEAIGNIETMATHHRFSTPIPLKSQIALNALSGGIEITPYAKMFLMALRFTVDGYTDRPSQTWRTHI